MWPAVLAAVAVTLVAVVLYANLVPGEKKIEHRIERLYGADTPEFARALSVLLGPELRAGNEVRLLRNGDEIFPAMLGAIRAAQRTVCFETFIYWSGDVGREFAEALCERARAGVRVHVLLDWLGSKRMDEHLIDTMDAAGVELRRYHRPRALQLRRLNNRTHRKLLIVDGAVGFTGGVGIADPWAGHAEDPDHWRDSHFQAHGPVVAQMQAVFLDNWIKATGAVLHGPDYFPALQECGTLSAQMFSSSPTGGSASMHLMYLLAVTCAQRSIYLQSAYFVPDRLAVQALCEAARRGVDVRVIVPGRHTDAAVVRKASRALWPPLLQAGVRIAEYQPTMFHCKVLVVDELLVSVGSTNFDNRSFHLNDEANLNVLDAGFSAQQVQVFRDDWSRSHEVTLAALQARPWHERATERMAAWLRDQL